MFIENITWAGLWSATVGYINNPWYAASPKVALLNCTEDSERALYVMALEALAG